MMVMSELLLADYCFTELLLAAECFGGSLAGGGVRAHVATAALARLN